MDRAAGFYPVGWEFESLRRRVSATLEQATPTNINAVKAITDRVDAAILEFKNAKLASSDQVIDVLLDIRQAALEL